MEKVVRRAWALRDGGSPHPERQLLPHRDFGIPASRQMYAEVFRYGALRDEGSPQGTLGNAGFLF